VDVTWHFPAAVEARKPCSIPLSITNLKGWLPSLSITVALEGKLSGQIVSPAIFVPSLLPKETLPRDVSFVPPRRGYFELERVRLYTKFPFGLLRKQWTMGWDDGQTSFYVHPALLELTEADYAGFLAGNEELTASDRRGEGSTISGLRDLAPEDSAKRIHWKASARHSTLLVRETDLDKKRDVEIFWPAWPALNGMTEKETEEFIEFTASLVAGFEERGHGVRFLINGETPVDEPMNYLSLVDVSHPFDERVTRFLGTGKRAALSDLSDRINVLGAYGQWKKRK
jgi:uncharacterized protein (DUF58 family)